MRNTCLHLADGNQLIAARFSAAIPRFIHVRNCGAGNLRSAYRVWNLRRVAANERSCMPNLRKDLRAIAAKLFFALNNSADFCRERVNTRIGMFPRIDERRSVEWLDAIANFRKLQQTRARGNQQTNRKLNWSDVLD